ncbi:hypothetical protein FDA84_15040 [Clostridium botulinum]|nr:hypothetical protein [Clostridium botulinum]
MFNTNSNISVSNHVNAVTGNIVKTYKDSYFLRFHLKSSLSDKLLKENSDKIVTQMVVCGDMEVIAEVMNKKLYNELFKTEVM